MPSLSPVRVLVIEDDDDTRANLHDILSLDHYYVESADSIAGALNRDNWRELSAIILDRRLADGIADEILPQLRESAPEAGIIIVTAYADLDGAIAAVREGASDYILKPINADALRASLARVVDRIRAEERLRHSERLAGIGQAMTGLAHESRNALQRSQACLEMLARRVADQPEAVELINRAQKAQDDLYRLYEEVREYAVPFRLRPERCHLGEIMNETWEQLAVNRQGRTARLHTEIAPTTDPFCEVDRFAVRQTFRNILENSLAACADPVEIQSAFLEVTFDGRPALCISICDNGPGLTTPATDGIFDAFYTTKTHGTGLGLAICKRFVEAHSGRISVGNGNPQGAEILITLPRKQS